MDTHTHLIHTTHTNSYTHTLIHMHTLTTHGHTYTHNSRTHTTHTTHTHTQLIYTHTHTQLMDTFPSFNLFKHYMYISTVRLHYMYTEIFSSSVSVHHHYGMISKRKFESMQTSQSIHCKLSSRTSLDLDQFKVHSHVFRRFSYACLRFALI